MDVPDYTLRDCLTGCQERCFEGCPVMIQADADFVRVRARIKATRDNAFLDTPLEGVTYRQIAEFEIEGDGEGVDLDAVEYDLRTFGLRNTARRLDMLEAQEQRIIGRVQRFGSSCEGPVKLAGEGVVAFVCGSRRNVAKECIQGALIIRHKPEAEASD